MNVNESDRATSGSMAALFVIGCFWTLVLITLTEQFGHLPPALAAFASAWCILRL